MIPRDFNIPDRDAAARFMNALGEVCDACNDGVHCHSCAITVIRQSSGWPEDDEEEGAND